ncbi:hypothetical protein [Agrobacterium sp. CG674]
MPEAGIGPHRFGILAVGNGRLVERLRSGGRVWPDTETRVRAFIKQLKRNSGKAPEDTGVKVVSFIEAERLKRNVPIRKPVPEGVS